MMLVLLSTQAWREKADVTPTPAKPVLTKQQGDQLSFRKAAPFGAQLTGPSYQECRLKMNIIS